jgi:uncharacterized protein DUF6650
VKFKEIVARLTGFSIPVFGVSWNPPAAEVTVARKVIAFLEDRRVLYNPYDMEDSGHCISSVIEIRQFLTGEFGNLTDQDGLAANLRAMRAACRKFLDTVDAKDYARYGFGRRGLAHDWVFMSGLGELRGVVGVHVAALAAQHGLDIEGELASILPAKPSTRDA